MRYSYDHHKREDCCRLYLYYLSPKDTEPNLIIPQMKWLKILCATSILVPTLSFSIHAGFVPKRWHVCHALPPSTIDDVHTDPSPSSRRCFLKHVATASTAGTISSLSIVGLTPIEAAAADSSPSLAGQIDLPPRKSILLETFRDIVCKRVTNHSLLSLNGSWTRCVGMG
jgi:hypothetical protein